MWNLLHTTSLTSPTRGSPEDTAKFKRVLETFRQACPCSVCRSSFNELLSMEKFDTSSAQFEPGVFAWELHNAVNTKLGRPEVTYENMYRRYQHAVEPMSSAQFWQLLYPIAVNAESAGTPHVGREFTSAAMDLASTLPQLRDSPMITGLRGVLDSSSGTRLSQELLQLGENNFGTHCQDSGTWCSVDRRVGLYDMRRTPGSKMKPNANRAS